MRNKFTLNEGEVQRILGLHKQAILKENGKNVLNEETTKTSYTTQKWNELELNTVIGGQGTRYALAKGTVFSLTDKKGVLRAKNTHLYTAMSGPGKKWFKGDKTSVSFFCAQGKFYIKGKKHNFYNSTLANALVKSICGVDPSEVVSKDGVDGTSNYNSKKDTKDKSKKDTKDKSNNNTKVKGNRYTFDFDAIMKAINDTGKCAGSSDGTNGTSGTQGTQGTSGQSVIQNPLPINNKISAELYYQITAP
jgi:hypothetical protein